MDDPPPICGGISLEPEGEPSTAPASLELAQEHEIPGFEACGSATLDVAAPGDPDQLVTVLVTFGFERDGNGAWQVGVWTAVFSCVLINPFKSQALTGYIEYKVTDVNAQREGVVAALIGQFSYKRFGLHLSRDYAIDLDTLSSLTVESGHLVQLALRYGDGSVKDITDPDNPKVRKWTVAGRVIGELVTPLS